MGLFGPEQKRISGMPCLLYGEAENKQELEPAASEAAQNGYKTHITYSPEKSASAHKTVFELWISAMPVSQGVSSNNNMNNNQQRQQPQQQ